MDSATFPDLVSAFVEGLDRLIPARVREGTWLVGYSGGPDSTALCLLLKEARAAGVGPREVICFHVNHGLRGEESDGDEAFARRFAPSLDFAFESIRLEPPAPESIGSVEAWAREQRYGAFLEAARKNRAGLVLTGHHENDQAETVILRILRGAGFRGLSGIRPLRQLKRGSPILLARPLLPFSRGRLEAFLAEREAPSVLDRSNLDVNFSQRNRIRKTLMPTLAKAFRQDDLLKELCAMAEEARHIHQGLTRGAAAALNRLILSHEDKEFFLPFAKGDEIDLALNLEQWQALPELLRYPVLQSALFRLSGSSVPLSRKVMEEVTRGLHTPGAVTVGKDFRIAWTEDCLQVEKKEEPIAPPSPLLLQVPGTVTFENGARITARLTEDQAEAEAVRHDPDPLIEVFDGDKAGKRLTVRARADADRFHPLGAGGYKKLKAILINHKIPRRKRAALALVCGSRDLEEEILWVAGIRMSHTCRITPATRRFLILQAFPS